jgi:hypothetical protein
MTATLGDFLTSASQRITAAASCETLPPFASAAVVAELDRMLTVMCRYARDCVRSYDRIPGTAWLARDNLPVPGAAEMLGRAAISMSRAADAMTGTRRRHPVVTGLRAAADCLAAGHDLLQTHYEPGWPGWDAGSPWAQLIGSRPVADALMHELAHDAQQLALLTSRLLTTTAAYRGPGVPPAARRALSTAAGCLIFTRLAMAEADTEAALPGPAAGRLLLYNIPVHLPPPRSRPAASRHVAALSAGAVSTAERLTHLARRADLPPAWPSPAASFTWRHNALAFAITGHQCEILLGALSDRATQLRLPRTRRKALRDTADAMRQARESWQAATRTWDPLTTGTGTALSPVADELNDLVLWIGRLARDDPAWTPARAAASRPRDPAGLAPAARDIPAIAAVVRHALDAVTRIARQDYDAASAAAARRGLYTPARLLPESPNRVSVYRYVPAAPGQLSDLLTAYRTAITASCHAGTSLTSLLATLGAPTPEHAIARAAIHNPAAARHLLTQPDPPQPASQRHPLSLPAAGELERYVTGLQITDTSLLLRAMALDRAKDLLTSEATARIEARTAPSLTALSQTRAAAQDLPGPRRPGQAGPAAAAQPSAGSGPRLPAARTANGRNTHR